MIFQKLQNAMAKIRKEIAVIEFVLHNNNFVALPLPSHCFFGCGAMKFVDSCNYGYGEVGG